MHTLTTSIQHSIGNPSQNNRKRNKRDPNWKKRGKTVTICRWYDTLYRETLKMTSKNTVRASKFNKVSGYKFNLQKSVASQCIPNKLAVREIKETIPFTTASKRI